MIVRSGFVSNSSSSSFIVRISADNIADELSKILQIVDDETLDTPAYTYSSNAEDKSLTIRRAIGRVYHDLCPVTDDQIESWKRYAYDSTRYTMQLLDSGNFVDGDVYNLATDIFYSDGIVDDLENTTETETLDQKFDAFVDKWEAIFSEWNKLVFNNFIKQHYGKLYVVEYSDNDDEDAMEHGDHWEHIPALRISHH